MLLLYYLRWEGTFEEFKEYIGQVKSVCDEVAGIDLKEVFIPTSEWSFSVLFETVSYDKAQEVYKLSFKKYGAHPQQTVAKVEILQTFEELGLPSP